MKKLFFIIGKTHDSNKPINHCIMDGIDFKALCKNVKKLKDGEEIHVKDNVYIKKEEFVYRWVNKDPDGNVIRESRYAIHPYNTIYLMAEYRGWIMREYAFEEDDYYRVHEIERMVKELKWTLYHD